MAKRNQGRFCIQFNVDDPRHLQAIESLEAQGRRKAQYIAEAILHYMNCSETPNIPVETNSGILQKTVESIVKEYLKKERDGAISEEERHHLPDTTGTLPINAVSSPEQHDEIDADLLASIQDSISTLRKYFANLSALFVKNGALVGAMELAVFLPRTRILATNTGLD